MTEPLLRYLEAHSNYRGLVIVRAPTLQKQLHAGFEQIHRALVSLERDRQIRILSPLPFLTVALPRKVWRGATQVLAGTPQKTEAQADRGHSYSFHTQSIESKAIAIEDGGAGEGAQLLQEILSTLGETDPSSFRGVLEHYSPSVVRSALERVRATPPEKVRKSRTALFRYLLAKSK